MLVEGVTEALDHQDEVMDIVGHSIKKAAKKLHRLELMMHNEPNEDAEMRDKLIWQEKMSKLLKYDVAKRLPTLREVQIAHYKKQKAMNKKSGHKPTLIEELKRPDSRQHLHGKSLQRFRESKKSQESGPQYYLGSKPEGEPIKVIKNYRGINSSFGTDRTLVVKEGRSGKVKLPTTSLPEWFHPGYYDTADKIYLQLRRPPSAAAKVPFKNSGRYPSEEDDMEKTRKRVLKSRMNFLPTASLAGSQAPTDSLELNQMQDSLTSTSPEYFYYSIYSRSATPQQFTRSSPRYASPSKCQRPHSRVPETGLYNPSNPWTSNSSTSTINSPVHHGSCMSPRTIHLSSSSCSSLPSSRQHEGYIAVDDINSEYFDHIPSSTSSYHSSSLSSLPSKTNPASLFSEEIGGGGGGSSNDNTDIRDVSLSTVDSLLLKAASRQKNKYKVPDYTLGALEHQTTSRLVIPPMEFPELDAEITSLSLSRIPPSPSSTHIPLTTNKPTSILNNLTKTIKEKEKEKQLLESLYAVTTSVENFETNKSNPFTSTTNINPATITTTTNTPASMTITTTPSPATINTTVLNKKEKKLKKNLANQTLDSIKLSSSLTKSSVVLNEEIPFDTSMSGFIEQWRRERNFVETDLMRPRQCICRHPMNEIKNKKLKQKQQNQNQKKQKQQGEKKRKGRQRGGMMSNESGSGDTSSPLDSLSFDSNDDQTSIQDLLSERSEIEGEDDGDGEEGEGCEEDEEDEEGEGLDDFEDSIFSA